MTDTTDTFESIGQVAERVVRKADNPWAWWSAALHNPKAIGVTLKMTTEPEQGFYRRRLHKDGQWIPVALWHDGDHWLALRGAQHEEKMVEADEEWLYCRSHPISVEEYDRVYAGAEWSDVDPTVHSQRRGPPKPGDNSGDRSESEMLADDIKASLDQMRQYKAIKDDEQAGKAQSLRSRLLELHRKADNIREKLVRPHLDAQRDINGVWQPMVKDAKAGADTLRGSLESYESAKLAKRRAEEEAARKAAEEAEKARQEQSFLAPEPEPLPEPAPVAAAPAPSTTIAGAYGRAASVSTEWEVTGLDDQDAVYGYMREHPDLKRCLLDLAKRATKAGHTVPGIIKTEVAKVR